MSLVLALLILANLTKHSLEMKESMGMGPGNACFNALRV